jgi:hypothetical protein
MKGLRRAGENIVASTPEVPVNAARRQVLVSLLLTGFSRVLKAVLELEEGLPSTPIGDCLRIFLCLPVVVGIGRAVRTFFGRSIADMTYRLENHRDAQLLGVDTSHRDLTQMDLSNAEPAGANLVRSDPSDTNLCGASPGAAIPEGAHLEGARLKGARLAEAESNNGTIMLEGRDGILASKPGDEPG